MNQHLNVQEYYGKTLQASADLKTDACCTLSSVPSYLKAIMGQIHPQVSARYYGCGLVVPESLEGLRILDLGSGSGQDVFVLSALVGEQGSVVGVDMTDEQLAVANAHVDYHRAAFGYEQANVEFKKGYIEKLDQLELADESFDLIISNCVINLSPDKRAVLEQAHRLLKPGGEMYFSDVYADRRVPIELQNDPELYGECLSGALYWNDFIQLAKLAGFGDPRLVEGRTLAIENEQVQEKIAGINFYSATFRLWKIAELEPAAQDYGQEVTYRGGVIHHEQDLVLDQHNVFSCGVETSVDGNTWRMLSQTRLAQYFDFSGGFDTHLGLHRSSSESVAALFLTDDTQVQTRSQCC